jgi:hypothetical protein
MKNIHLIPTDKPSRLYEFGGRFNIQDKEQENFRNFNIYITSDEEIKEGDWYISILENEVYKATKETQNIMSVANLVESTSYKKTHFKIILTTDQDLIKDGVQAIDDEFLEWFVKNPSCEFVDVNYDSFEKTGNISVWEYEIIIPKEKLKKIDSCYNFDKEIGSVQDICRCEQEEPKQKTTLEEEAENSALKHFLFPKELFFKMCKCSQNDYLLEEEFGLDNTTKYREILGFIEGAKWQAENMYSKEEVMDMFHKFSMHLPLHYEFLVREQFKKK